MEDKAALRARVRGARAARTPQDARREALALRDVVLAEAVVRDALRVACYVSVGAEPGTAPLLAGLRDLGVEVLLPVVDGASLDWALADGTYAPGPYGLLEPAGPRLGAAAAGTCDVLLVPALAVDARGARLGQGAGYYDRSLAGLAARPTVVALVHDEELLAAGAVPARSHDVPVDAVASPSRWTWLTSSGPRQ